MVLYGSEAYPTISCLSMENSLTCSKAPPNPKFWIASPNVAWIRSLGDW